MIGYLENDPSEPARPALAVGHWRVRSVCAAEAPSEREPRAKRSRIVETVKSVKLKRFYVHAARTRMHHSASQA